MKIGIISPHIMYMTGGAEVNDINLGAALEENGHEITYIAASDKNKESKESTKKLTVLTVEMRYWYAYALSMKGKGGAILRHSFEKIFARNVLKARRSEITKFDIFFVTGRPVNLDIGWKCGVPIFQSIRGVFNEMYWRYYNKASGLIFWGGCEEMHPAHVLLKHKHICEDAPIETSIFHPGHANENWRNKMTDGGKKIAVVSTNRLDPIQQIDQIIKTTWRVVDDGWPLKLTIVGDGSEGSNLKELAHSTLGAENVEFVGRKGRAEIGKILRSADVYIMNPRFTSYSLALKEALACGVMAIAPRTGKVATSLDAGDHAKLFSPGVYEEMEKVFKDILETGEFKRKDETNRHYHGSSWSMVADRLAHWVEKNLEQPK